MNAVRTLVREGADPNASMANGAPALQWVVHAQDLDTARVLLEAGANPNLPSVYGTLPLHLAVSNGDPAISYRRSNGKQAGLRFAHRGASAWETELVDVADAFWQASEHPAAAFDVSSLRSPL